MNLKDLCILITGGTGSFGHSMVEHLLGQDIQEIRIFSRDEQKQESMRLRLNDHRLKFYIGDIRDFDAVSQAMKGVDYVFHAAALKQVPSCEFYPLEAVRTNVLGAENVLNAAIGNRVKRLVVLSTDKAVYPINAMGMSKGMMEKLMVAKARMLEKDESVLCGTRYGNVMASRGSVIPRFVEQIRGGGPITITDARMTRYLMSLEESVDLVMHAFEHGQQGDIFVQKSPAATVGDLAQALKEVFASDCDVKIIGTRHGEKLHETLLSREEMAKAEDLGRYYRVSADGRDLDHHLYFDKGEEEISLLDDYTSHNTERLGVEEVKNLLLKLEYIQRQLHA